MRVSRYALVSLACLPIAGIVYLLGWLKGNSMVAAGHGFEMAFYLSPMIFCVVDAILWLGVVTAAIGVVITPGRYNREKEENVSGPFSVRFPRPVRLGPTSEM